MSYTVRSGDTMSGIAARNHLSLLALERANPNVTNPNRIFVGERLNLPGSSDSFTPSPSTTKTSGTYTVRAGDTMSGIAGRSGVTLSALLQANPQVRNANQISVGQRLNLPSGSKAPTTGGSTGVGAPVAGTVGQWISQAQAVLRAAGVPDSKMNSADINLIIQHESSGNPNAENDWDSNWRAGHPSIGLMQTIQPTFDGYKLPGHGNIRNPVDNIIAGVRYAISRYGSISNVPGVVDVHAGRAYVGY